VDETGASLWIGDPSARQPSIFTIVVIFSSALARVFHSRWGKPGGKPVDNSQGALCSSHLRYLAQKMRNAFDSTVAQLRA
jgi:hypothetical protein